MMNFKALINKSELTKVSAGGHSGDGGGGTAPTHTQSLSGTGSGGGVEPPEVSYSLTRAEMAKVAGGNGGGDGIQPPKAEVKNGAGGVIDPAL